MKGLMQESVLPKLKESFHLPYIFHKTILTYGMGESRVAERIEDWENKLPTFIKLAYLPSYGMVRLRLTAKGTTRNILKISIASEVEKLYELIPDIIVGQEDDETIQVMIGKLLHKKKFNLATAESFTGGNIAKMITSVPGSSNYFVGSVVAYNVSVKIKELDVAENLIQKYSVVSAQVAEAMARGIQQKFNTTFSVATTGIAGPTTDYTGKPIGTVFIAIATPKYIFSKEYFFGNPREKVIERASVKALELLKKEILKN